ncbi:MAG: hypothetical protein IT379_33005 [Deltaproteobacteria bacterium]|nr:hypothetical protein [Deltaproteobacteria bacterium]
MRRSAALHLALALVAVVGCGDDAASEIDVAVSEAAPGLSRRVESLGLTVAVLGADGERTVRTEETEARYEGERLRGWTVRVRPESSRDPGTVLYRFRVTARADGADYVSAQARVVFLSGTRFVLPLRLDDSCTGLSLCGADETCASGRCVSDFVPACDLVAGGRPASCFDSPDATTPPPLDAASTDAGELDAPVDAGPIDDATIDAPTTDVGPDDAGLDDATVDACVPIADCASGGFACGEPPDGCGGALACGECTVTGESCGGGGVAYRCGRATTPDTTAPTVTITSAPDQTRAPSYDVVFTGADTGGSELDRFECSIDGGPFETCASPVTFTDQTEGPHDLAVRAVDGAGNVSDVASTSWCTDRSAPVITVRSRPPMVGRSTDARFVIEVTDGPSCASGTSSECGLDAEPRVACPGTHMRAGLSDGMHSFGATARDAAGNTAAETVDFVVDTRPPSLMIPPIPARASTSYGETLSVPFTFACTDSGSGCDTASAACTVDGASADVTCTWGSGTASVGVASSLDFGTRRLRVSVRDVAGNTFATEQDFTVSRCAGDMQYPDRTSNGLARGPCCAGLVVSDWVDPVGLWPARADASCRPMSDFEARLFETPWGGIGCQAPLRTTTDWGATCDTDAGRVTCLDSAAAAAVWCGDDAIPTSCPGTDCPTPFHGLAGEGWHGPVSMGCASGVMALDELAIRGGFYGGCFTTVGNGNDRWSVSATQSCKPPAMRWCRTNAPAVEVSCVCAARDPYADDGHG